MPVQMELAKIIISEMADQQVIVLKEVDGERNFAIVIGPQEAWAIDRRLKGHATPRPMTHDLLKSAIAQLDGRVTRIVINDLRDSTFFAQIRMMVNRAGSDTMLELDARPSDAIALALRAHAPSFVDTNVIEAAMKIDPTEDAKDTERLRKWLETLDESELGKQIH